MLSARRAPPDSHRAERARTLLAATLVATLAGCDDSPTRPTPTPLALTCPAAISTFATSTSGAVVNYAAPIPAGGRAPVTVSCSTDSGRTFPVGTTPIACTAQDAAGQTAACTFDVRVAMPPRLSRTRFVAFGDSITAGEVTVPTASPGGWTRLIVVPAASYPTVLGDRLSQSYPLQSVTMVNAGQPGQSAAAALSRFADVYLREQPEVILLLMGYNDLGSPAGVSAAANVLEVMVRESRIRGTRVLIGTLTPTIPGRQRSMNQVLLDDLNGRIRAIASSQGVPLVDLYAGFQSNISGWVGVDGLHPNEAGYARIAELFFSAVRADLEVP